MAVASAALRYPMAARSIPSASVVVAGDGTALTWFTSWACRGLMIRMVPAVVPLLIGDLILITCSRLAAATDIPWNATPWCFALLGLLETDM
jgi:hypothetical protein